MRLRKVRRTTWHRDARLPALFVPQSSGEPLRVKIRWFLRTNRQQPAGSSPARSGSRRTDIRNPCRKSGKRPFLAGSGPISFQGRVGRVERGPPPFQAPLVGLVSLGPPYGFAQIQELIGPVGRFFFLENGPTKMVESRPRAHRRATHRRSSIEVRAPGNGQPALETLGEAESRKGRRDRSKAPMEESINVGQQEGTRTGDGGVDGTCQWV